MAKVLRKLTVVTCCAAIGLVAGFIAFAGTVGRYPVLPASGADGIVVLTGSDDRIATGLDLMSEGRGRRLLISGVHPRNRSPEELSRRLGETSPACCIDLGYRAQNTIGNADEARDWATRWGFHSLIVVTSDFHMPRSMTEFARAMPDMKLIAHPVPSRYLRAAWWENHVLIRSLAGEYVKFLAANVRLGASRMMGAVGAFSYAERKPPSPRTG